jgi:hypothetical protein
MIFEIAASFFLLGTLIMYWHTHNRLESKRLRSTSKNYCYIQARLVYFISCLLIFVQLQSVSANSDNLNIPDSLQDWKSWVLHDNKQLLCPDSINGQVKFCVWPGRLKLYLDEKQQYIDFDQKLTVYGKSKVFLPGGETVWPEKVTINKQSVTVLEFNQRPYIWLETGSYQLSGILVWQGSVNYIPLSKETVLVDLLKYENASSQLTDFENNSSEKNSSVKNSSDKKLAVLQKKMTIDSQNRLWLKQLSTSKVNPEQKRNDSLDIKVYRKISDGIPLLMESFYRIKVSGSAREMTINNVIAPNFTAYSYSSQLPARLSADNSLVLQLKPGTWTFSLTARAVEQVNELAFFSKPLISKPLISKQAEADPSLPKSEIWVFKEDLSLQQVEASSKQSIDPGQTLMPAAWKKLPAFLMQKNSILKLELKKRGNATPAANNLSLQRRLWLDFSGQGMTVEDHIYGEMNRDWRLNLMPQIIAGKVSLNNQAQLITLSKNNQSGVEVQNGKINLLAESRIEKNINTISATGWQEDFKQLKATLYLPPGWSIFHAVGVDQLSSGWINQWTLLDLFQVLLLSIIFYRLWGVIWGVIALCCFVLLQHRIGAPIWIWLHILLAIGLLRLVNKGKLHLLLGWYKNISIVVLIFTLLPFLVSEIRSSIYPQLKISSYQLDSTAKTQVAMMEKTDYDEEPELMSDAVIAPQTYRKLKQRVAKTASLTSGSYLPTPAPVRQKKLNQYDANAKIQTGPGLPGWSFNPVKLIWSGPVSQQQQVQFYFISPRINLLLSLLMLLFSAVLVYRVVNSSTISASFSAFVKNNVLTQSKQEQSKQEQSKIMILFVLFIAMSSTGLYPENVTASQIENAQTDEPLSHQSTNQENSYPPEFLLDELKKRLTKPALCHPQCALIENMHIVLSGSQLTLRLIVNSGTFISMPLPLDEKLLTIEEIIIDEQSIDHYRNKRSADPRQLSLPLIKGKHHLLIHATVHGDSLVLPLNIPTYNVSYEIKNWTISGLKNSQPNSKQLILQKKQTKIQTTDKKQVNFKQSSELENNIPIFVLIKRRFYFDLEWTIETTITRLSDKSRAHSMALVFDYPLLDGESVISSNKKIKQNAININLAPAQNHFSWSSRLKKSAKLQLQAKTNPYWVEQWEMLINPVWHVEHQGLAPIQHINSSKSHQPIWRPWPGESLDLSFVRPKAIRGNTRTLTNTIRKSSYGNKLSEHQLDLNFNSSQGGQQIIILPENVRVISLIVSGKSLAIDEKKNTLEFSLSAGKQQVQIKWRENNAISSKITTSAVNVGLVSVNSHQKIDLPRDRWTIYTSGPSVGPVVLIWGMLLVILVIAFGVSKIPGMPLSSIQALLLAIGLAPVSLWSLLVVFLWFVVIMRRKQASELSPFIFNSMQLGLVLFTITTLGIFIYTIQSGLLGYPDMHIMGNGSSAYQLNWYQDRATAQLPQAMLISLPIYWYRILMLLWALWLAFISIRWAIWAWQNFSYGGYWKKITWKRKAIKHLAKKNNASKE